MGMVGVEGRSGWQRLPDLVTATRPGLGLVSGLAVATGHGALGGWMYLAGFLSDVADGLLARRLGVQSEAGTVNDGRADVAFHALVGAGLVIAAVREQQWWVLAVLAALLAGGPLVRPWVAVHTVVGKAIGGAYRVIIFSTFVAFAEPSQRVPLIIGGLVVLCTTYVYEARVTLAELRSGERTMR